MMRIFASGVPLHARIGVARRTTGSRVETPLMTNTNTDSNVNTASNGAVAQLHDLPGANVTVVRTVTDRVILIEGTRGSVRTVELGPVQAVTVQKLLAMSGDPVPDYRGIPVYALTDQMPPREPGKAYTRGPFLEPTENNDEDGVRFASPGDGDRVTVPGDAVPELVDVLDEWGYTLTDADRPSVVSLPGMIRVDNGGGDGGIAEPVLHAEHDEVLEHYHQPIGYWSAEQDAYVAEH